MSKWLQKLNIIAECRALRWGLWECPPFLFLVLGFTIILAMMTTWLFASQYFVDEPELAALVVAAITVLLLLVGNFIIAGFNRVAEANRMKTEFITLISHQLRSPLSIFKWTVDLMERAEAGGKKDEEAERDLKHSLSILHDSTESMIRMVNMLLDVSRIEAHTFILKKERFSLEKLAAEAIQRFERYARASNISLKLISEPSLPEIEADKDRMAMVIENLLDNAIKYSKDGVISVKIENRKVLRLSVEDQGLGIPRGEQQYIFAKFFRAKNIRGTHTNGTGIGLYIAKQIIESSGGKIGFQSEEGKGSIFWFTLPITNHK